MTEGDLGGNPQAIQTELLRLHRAADVAFAAFVVFEVVATWQLNKLRPIGIFNRIPSILQAALTLLLLAATSYALVFLSFYGFVPDPVITANTVISEWILKVLPN